MKTPIDRRCFAASPFARGFGTALLVLPVLAQGCCFQHRRKKTRSTKPGKQVIIACMFSNRQTVMDIPQHPPLILASSSVYRRELLARLRLPFQHYSPDVDETPMAGETPAALAVRLALAKAQAIFTQHPDAIVIGADQVADLDGQALG